MGWRGGCARGGEAVDGGVEGVAREEEAVGCWVAVVEDAVDILACLSVAAIVDVV